MGRARSRTQSTMTSIVSSFVWYRQEHTRSRGAKRTSAVLGAATASQHARRRRSLRHRVITPSRTSSLHLSFPAYTTSTPYILIVLFSYNSSGDHTHLRSFPTRRSSDLI